MCSLSFLPVLLLPPLLNSSAVISLFDSFFICATCLKRLSHSHNVFELPPANFHVLGTFADTQLIQLSQRLSHLGEWCFALYYQGLSLCVPFNTIHQIITKLFQDHSISTVFPSSSLLNTLPSANVNFKLRSCIPSTPL